MGTSSLWCEVGVVWAIHWNPEVLRHYLTEMHSERMSDSVGFDISWSLIYQRFCDVRLFMAKMITQWICPSLTCTFQSAQWVTATSRPDSPHIVLTSCVKWALAYWKLHLHASQIIAKEKLHVITHSGIKWQTFYFLSRLTFQAELKQSFTIKIKIYKVYKFEGQEKTGIFKKKYQKLDLA